MGKGGTMSNEETIENLRSRIEKENNPEKLHSIAAQLRDLGAWDVQFEAESKARRIEQKQAERVNA